MGLPQELLRIGVALLMSVMIGKAIRQMKYESSPDAESQMANMSCPPEYV